MATTSAPAPTSPPDASPGPDRRVEDPLANPWKYDAPASIVVVLVALPLCLGIALASGAPLASGLIAGIVGGIVVGALSGSHLMVSGPAAGLTAIVLAGITQLGSFPAFLAAVVLGGALQLGLGVIRAGVIGYYFPSSVIRGMLAAIGIILILKQLPHAVGYDADFEGDEAFVQADGGTTFSAIGDALSQIQPGAALVCLLGLAVLVGWTQVPALKRLKLLPAPLFVVLLGVGLNRLFAATGSSWEIRPDHLVQLPVPQQASDLMQYLAFPDFSLLGTPAVWQLGVTLAIVASLETLLSLEATDKMDPFKRESDTNRELLAQGTGNLVSGLIGGLPVTGVIVRSSANIDAGARTRRSAILHGLLLIACVAFIPALLNHIPLAALAAILLQTGYKLASPALWRTVWARGMSQFVPFAVTIVAIVLTDLLKGIAIGMVVGVGFILYEYLRLPALTRVSPEGAVLTRFELPDQVTFLMKANIERTLEALPAGSRVEIDGRRTRRIDYDALEILREFQKTAALRNIDYRIVGVPDIAVTPSH